MAGVCVILAWCACHGTVVGACEAFLLQAYVMSQPWEPVLNLVMMLEPFRPSMRSDGDVLGMMCPRSDLRLHLVSLAPG